MPRRALGCAFTWLLAASLGGAPAQACGLEVIRLDESFPEASRGDLQAVAEDVLAVTREVTRRAPPAGLRPVVCYVRPQGPICDATSKPELYRVGLTVTGRGYAQFSYQLGHELAHIMLDPRRTNGLLETLAMAFSLRVLDELDARWRQAPPFGNWRSYAPAFGDYRRRQERRLLAGLPPEIATLVEGERWSQVALYLRYRRADQDAHPEDRSLNMLGALAARASRPAWPRMVGLGSWTSPPPERDGAFRSSLAISPGVARRLRVHLGRGRPQCFVAALLERRPGVDEGVVLRRSKGWLLLREWAPYDGASLGRFVARCDPEQLTWEAGWGGH